MRENHFPLEESNHEQRVALFEKAVEEDFRIAFGSNQALTEEQLISCYEIAFTTIEGRIKKEIFDVTTLKSEFVGILNEQIFNKKIINKLQKGRHPIPEILDNERATFLGIIPKEEYNEGSANDTFISFTNYIEQLTNSKNLNTISSSLQKKFLSIYNQTLAINALISNGNGDAQWLGYVKKLERSKNGMLLNFGKLRYGVNGITIHDVFNDAIIKLEENLKQGKFNSQSTIETYFESIFRNTCFDTLRKNQPKEIPNNEEVLDFTRDPRPNAQTRIENRELFQELKNQFIKAIDSLDEKCKKILPLVGRQFDNYRIMKELNWVEESQVRTKKSNCLKDLKNRMPILKGSIDQMKEALIMLYNSEF